MTPARPVRCPGKHPDDEHRECRARLFDAVPDTVVLKEGAIPPPGCPAIECWRCGTKWVACGRAA